MTRLDLSSRLNRLAMRWLGLAVLSLGTGKAIAADDPDADPAPTLEEVVTTATKRGAAQTAQDVASAVSVLGSEELATRHVTDIEDLSYALPNVAFDGIGTGKGIANFSIRGMGVAGSIPSIDPTVGVFVDGMYLGVNYGVIMDMLDLEAVEVLRGPQGLLFGRNVTGGAVLLRSRRPSGQRAAEAAVRVETGPDRRATGAFESSFAGGAVDARLAASYRDDAGWFENDAPGGGAVGAETSWAVRPVATFRPRDDLDVTLILERGKSDGDGPATQNRHRYGGFDFAIDEPGFSLIDWGHAVIEANRRVARGTVTNVFGARSVRHESLADIDSTIRPVFHLLAFTDQEQVSNELRYSGWLGSGWTLTGGIYFFGQRIEYRERRAIRGTWGAPFGGNQRHHTLGAFVNNDIELGEGWVASVGARYTVEKKAAKVATAGAGACEAVSRACRFDFEDDDSWRNVTPRVALQRWLGSWTQIYGQWTRGFRSGGYNLRNTSPTGLPGPFDEEKQDAFEVGLKAELPRLRLNVAAFRYAVRGLQRQVTRADAAQAAIQVTANTADATVQGIEAEAVAAAGDACTVSGFAGVADGAYDRVRFDLDGDGTTAGDEDLELPRLAPLTFGVAGECRRGLGRLGELAARIGLAHRDDSEIAHDNTGVLDGGDVLDASVSLAPFESLKLTVYGRNLLGEVFRRSHFDLTGLVDSTYSPLKEGRVVGLELTWNLR